MIFPRIIIIMSPVHCIYVCDPAAAVDNMGDPEDLRFQTGDAIATPYPFIRALAPVSSLMLPMPSGAEAV